MIQSEYFTVPFEAAPCGQTIAIFLPADVLKTIWVPVEDKRDIGKQIVWLSVANRRWGPQNFCYFLDAVSSWSPC